MLVKAKKPLRVVYLGGFYAAEYSMLYSFHQNDADMIFLIDTNNFGRLYNANYIWKENDYVWNLPAAELADYLKSYHPDAIIHRYYMDDPVMHHNSYEIARKLKIPFIKYSIETDYFDNRSCKHKTGFDLMLYAHDTDYFTESAKRSKKPMVFYPYGVSGFERKLKIEAVKNIGSIGRARPEIKQRTDNLKFYIDAVAPLGEKISTYGFDWVNHPLLREISFEGRFSAEKSTDIINQFKVMINFESMPQTEGAYSHKMFQTVGCGIPTVTNWKKCYEKMFGDNVILVRSHEETTEMIRKLLTDKKFREKTGAKSESFFHSQYDWYDRLYEIFTKYNII